jgi:hypothetical protein
MQGKDEAHFALCKLRRVLDFMSFEVQHKREEQA